VPLIKRHRSLTEAVLTSFGSTNEFPKTNLLVTSEVTDVSNEVTDVSNAFTRDRF
jgi:hypothetical protein